MSAHYKQSITFLTVSRFFNFALFGYLFLALSTPLGATSATTGTDQFGRTCDLVTWTDSTGNPRTVWIVNQTPGSFISKMTYYAGGSLVTATVPTTGFAFCTLVNHYYSASTNFNDNFGGNYTSNNGASNPASAQPGGQHLRFGRGRHPYHRFRGHSPFDLAGQLSNVRPSLGIGRRMVHHGSIHLYGWP